MTWNNRIVSTLNEMGNEHFELAEVFYDSDGFPYAYGNATISSEDVEGLYTQVEWFKKSLDLPILKYPEHFTGDVNK
jgi:hypothetical protein